MPKDMSGPLGLRIESERWVLASPFKTAAHTVRAIDTIVVYLEKDGVVGRGEAAGVFYKHEDVASMSRQIESIRDKVERGTNRDELQQLLPIGGARNALDCALWDLEAKVRGLPAWEMADLPRPKPLLTTFTCGADEPDRMAARARGYTGARAIKLKLTGESIDAARVRAVRDAMPEAWLAVDGNQGFTLGTLEGLMPVLLEARVALMEQPFPVGQDALLDAMEWPLPMAADESVQGIDDIRHLVGRYKVVNIKLDKCGGVTEALAMARAAQALGLDSMIGNMIGTSLAMAPAFLVGQLCKVVDLDGPVYLAADRALPVRYVDGYITCSEGIWGAPAESAGH